MRAVLRQKMPLEAAITEANSFIESLKKSGKVSTATTNINNKKTPTTNNKKKPTLATTNNNLKPLTNPITVSVRKKPPIIPSLTEKEKVVVVKEKAEAAPSVGGGGEERGESRIADSLEWLAQMWRESSPAKEDIGTVWSDGTQFFEHPEGRPDLRRGGSVKKRSASLQKQYNAIKRKRKATSYGKKRTKR